MITAISMILVAVMGLASMLSARYGLALLRNTPARLRPVGILWWMLVLGTGVFFTRTGSVAMSGGLDASARMQLGLYFIAGLMAILLFLKHDGARVLTRFPVLALAMYGVTGLISTLYSPAPYLTLYKASLIILGVMAIAATVPMLRRHGKPMLVFDIAVFVAILFVVGAFVGVLIRPSDAIRTLGAGGIFGFILDGAFPYMNGNELGFLSAVVALIALSRLFQPQSKALKLFWLACCAVGMAGMIFAQARTAIAGFVVGLLILSIAVPRIRKLAVTITILVVLGFVGKTVLMPGGESGFGDTVEEYLTKGQAEGGLQSFMGRLRAWESAGAGMFSDSPILGHGFDVGVRYGGQEFGIGGTHMHNSHVQILANSGLLGYLPWLGMVAWVFISFTGKIARGLTGTNTGGVAHYRVYEMYVVLLMLLLRTMTGSVMVNHSLTLIFLMGIIIYLLSSRSVSSVQVGSPEVNTAHTKPGAQDVLARKRRLKGLNG